MGRLLLSDLGAYERNSHNNDATLETTIVDKDFIEHLVDGEESSSNLPSNPNIRIFCVTAGAMVDASSVDGAPEGSSDGTSEGYIDMDGLKLGVSLGEPDGLKLGVLLGTQEGADEGILDNEGILVGVTVGAAVGLTVGAADGEFASPPESSSVVEGFSSNPPTRKLHTPGLVSSKSLIVTPVTRMFPPL